MIDLTAHAEALISRTTDDMTDEQRDAEYDRVREVAHTDIGTCLMPDSHAPGHPADMKFGVWFREAGSDDFEYLTEAEMVEKYGVETDEGTMLPGFTFLSFFDFWYAP